MLLQDRPALCFRRPLGTTKISVRLISKYLLYIRSHITISLAEKKGGMEAWKRETRGSGDRKRDRLELGSAALVGTDVGRGDMELSVGDYS